MTQNAASLRSSRPLSGQELAALRRGAGLTQTELAQAAGVGRHTVSYWEVKAWVDPRGWAPKRLFAVLGIKAVPGCETSTRAHGDGVLHAAGHRLAHKAARGRVSCGARTRKGKPCRMLSEPGRTRCKFHGGKSTGPRTAEGRAQVAEAQRQRWAKWRALKRGSRSGT